MLTTWVHTVRVSQEDPHLLAIGHWLGFGVAIPFSFRQFLMSDSAELSVATTLSSWGKACWKPKVMRSGQHYTAPTAAHTLCCVKPLIFFFPLEVVGEDLLGFWWASLPDVTRGQLVWWTVALTIVTNIYYLPFLVSILEFSALCGLDGWPGGVTQTLSSWVWVPRHHLFVGCDCRTCPFPIKTREWDTKKYSRRSLSPLRFFPVPVV